MKRGWKFFGLPAAALISAGIFIGSEKYQDYDPRIGQDNVLMQKMNSEVRTKVGKRFTPDEQEILIEAMRRFDNPLIVSSAISRIFVVRDPALLKYAEEVANAYLNDNTEYVDFRQSGAREAAFASSVRLLAESKYPGWDNRIISIVSSKRDTRKLRGDDLSIFEALLSSYQTPPAYNFILKGISEQYDQLFEGHVTNFHYLTKTAYDSERRDYVSKLMETIARDRRVTCKHRNLAFIEAFRLASEYGIRKAAARELEGIWSIAYALTGDYRCYD